jgi:transcriptional regulator with XRE-family HTH domain
MTAYDLAPPPTTDGEEWFRHVGTTSPTVALGPRKFIACVFMAGCAATGTLAAVTPADALALNTIVVQPSTLPGVIAQPTSALNNAAIPEMLQRLRRASGLSWGDLGRTVGVSRRTIHNWLGGARVAGVHLTRLLQVSHTIDLLAGSSAESTRAALFQPMSSGRSIIEDLALAARPARPRPISTISVGDLVAPTDGTDRVGPKQPTRRSSLRGQVVPSRRAD